MDRRTRRRVATGVATTAAIERLLDRCRRFEEARGPLGCDAPGVDCNRLMEHYLSRALEAAQRLDFVCRLDEALDHAHLGEIVDDM